LQFESGLLQISKSKAIITRQEAEKIAGRSGVEKDKVTDLFVHSSHKSVLLSILRYHPCLCRSTGSS